MRTTVNILLLNILILTQGVVAQQICKSYITDEWPNSRYTIEVISGDNVVTDNKTGLMWKQCIEGLTGTDCIGTMIFYTWEQALYLASAEEFARYSDWRVPNHKELHTIVARNCYYPSINEAVFPNTFSTSGSFPSRLWSSSPYLDSTWIVDFEFGHELSDERNNYYRVRLVRSLR